MITKPLAVITGASSGIGYELAKQFAQNGFDLIIAAEDHGIKEAKSAFEALGASVEAVQIDLCEEAGVERLFESILADERRVDAIALNAGVGVGGDFARNTDLTAELRLIDLNVRSTVHLAKLVLQDMVEEDHGRLLFTASIASTMPGPFEAVYSASKAFILSFAEALRNELQDTNITVTALMPGPTETNFFHRAGMDDTKVGASKKDNPAVVAREGYEALMAGDAKIIAGSFKNKLNVAMGKVLPDATSAEIHRGLSEPGTGYSN